MKPSHNLHSVQNKIKKMDLLCRLCKEEEETFDHFVNDCPIGNMGSSYFLSPRPVLAALIQQTNKLDSERRNIVI